ncbi:MAG: prolyl oligopeptidase family serine peptidase [Gemmatimonadales bacterium]
MPSRLLTALAAVALVVASSLSAQQPRDRLTLADYLDFEDVQNPQLSPDGQQIIFTRRWIDKVNDRWESSLWIMDADGSRLRFLVTGSDVQWSPDGRRIAYLARGEPAGTQLHVRWMDAEGAVTQITRVERAPADIRWSPDGTQLAFRTLVPMKERWNITIPAAPQGAKWVESPYVVERLSYRRDRAGFTDQGFQQLFVVPADGGTPRQVTDGPWDHGAPQWMQDGQSLVFSSLRVADAEWYWRESEIYAVRLADQVVRPLTSRKGPDGNPTVSPDGRFIAYTGFDSTGATWQDAQLSVMNADGTNHRVLTASLDRSPQQLIWAPDNSGIYFTTEDRGSRNLHFASLSSQVRQVTSGTHVLGITGISAGGQVVGVRTAPQNPPDVVTFTLRQPEPRQLTRVNEDILAGKTLGEVEEIWYDAPDGLRIQGWIVKPPGFDAARKYPMMLSIHGGPHAMYNVGFNFGWQEHAANGYVVLYTNPRGSTGYGSAFGNAIKNAYPGKDYDDLMSGVDGLLARGYVDERNMFVYGCSGGGVLTSWIVGQTDRFAAASANCPVTNWLSFVGTTDGPSWYRNFEHLPWEDPSEHLRRSPLMYVGNVKTPTMLMTGVNDLRTPMPQTEEYYQALKLLKVPTAMVRFNEEWHGTSSRPSNFLRTQAYLRHWFGRFSAAPAADRE